MVIVLLAMLVCSYGNLEAAPRLPDDLTKMTLEDLMDVEVTSVSKKAEKLSDAAAAIFVITQEDIRRSGVTSIPEALRMAPGIEVARIDENKWAITSRGFNRRCANKLLVLIDGRTVYTPLFSGVYWDIQDTLLEDLDRIEVIRGPGAALWGANAVNGVINIITKQANNTQGGLVSGGSGTEERGFASGRFGGLIGKEVYYRVYAKYSERDPFESFAVPNLSHGDFNIPSGSCLHCHDRLNTQKRERNGWETLQGGFRLDWQRTSSDSLTLQGDIYGSNSGESLTVASFTYPFARDFTNEPSKAGGNILARWKYSFCNSSDMALQLYYDRTEGGEASAKEFRDTFDLDFQYRFAPNKRQEVMLGLGYRYTREDFEDSFTYLLYPQSRDDQLFSTFIQDEIEIMPSRLRLILGSKFEHNDYTGFEIQPNARLLWKPHALHTLWAAVSRAVRIPSRAEHDIQINALVLPPGISQNPGPLPVLVSFFGNNDFDSEELLAYEIGYRTLIHDLVSIDVAAFYNI
jgi:iron complex outermembrane receptor protein